MTIVVTEICIMCKYRDCVDVCPTVAFREGPNCLAIYPDDCIDCMLCVVECPVDAIFVDGGARRDHAHFIALDVQLARIQKSIIEDKTTLSDADEWGRMMGKLDLQERSRIGETSVR